MTRSRCVYNSVSGTPFQARCHTARAKAAAAPTASSASSHRSRRRSVSSGDGCMGMQNTAFANEANKGTTETDTRANSLSGYDADGYCESRPHTPGELKLKTRYLEALVHEQPSSPSSAPHAPRALERCAAIARARRPHSRRRPMRSALTRGGARATHIHRPRRDGRHHWRGRFHLHFRLRRARTRRHAATGAPCRPTDAANLNRRDRRESEHWRTQQ